jgi:hypothetical protein
LVTEPAASPVSRTTSEGDFPHARQRSQKLFQNILRRPPFSQFGAIGAFPLWLVCRFFTVGEIIH